MIHTLSNILLFKQITVSEQLRVNAVTLAVSSFHCRETKISQLERLLEESKETVKELHEGKLHYMGLYRELESKASRLESRSVN